MGNEEFVSSVGTVGRLAIGLRSDRRATEDWVTFITPLVDEHYPEAECIRLVLANLSIPAGLRQVL